MSRVQPGAQAWSAEDGDVGVLVLHGFTGNPVATRPLAEALTGAGFGVEMPRLPGHGTSWRELQHTTWRDWSREAVCAFAALRARTRLQFVAGLSLGGTLALELAEHSGDDLAGLVLINPSLFSNDSRLHALPVLKWLVPSLPGVGNDIAKPGADEQPYARVPLKALASLTHLQRRVRAGLAAVTTPTLVLTSRQDHLVEPANSQLVMDRISSPDKRQLWLEDSYHVATLDYDAERIAQESIGFIRRLATEAAAAPPL
jgi:carboxylesterase